MIDDILDLATIDEDAMALELSDVDVESTMRSAIEGVQDRLEENSIDIQIVAMDNVGSFRGDAKRVRHYFDTVVRERARRDALWEQFHDAARSLWQ